MLADLSGEKPQMNMNALYKLTLGLYILGCRDGKRTVGSVVDAVMQVANKPFMIALSCHDNSYTKLCIEKARCFSLSVVGADVEPFVIANFGFQTSRNVDKWAKVDYITVNNLPYLKDTMARIEAKVTEIIAYDSNTLFLAEVVDSWDCKCGDALTYNQYRAYFKDKVIESFNKYRQQLLKEKSNV